MATTTNDARCSDQTCMTGAILPTVYIMGARRDMLRLVVPCIMLRECRRSPRIVALGYTIYRGGGQGCFVGPTVLWLQKGHSCCILSP